MTEPVRPVALFYADEDLADDLCPILRGLGFDAVHTREVGNNRQIDPTQLTYARRHGRILLTANLGDFRLPHEAWLVWTAELGLAPTAMHGGIIVLPNPNEMDAAAMARLIAEFVRNVAPAELANRLLRYRLAAGWEELSAVRRPTIRPG